MKPDRHPTPAVIARRRPPSAAAPAIGEPGLGRLGRLSAAERRWDGPVPAAALSVALAGSPERAQAARIRAAARGLDRAADDLRRAVARRRQALVEGAAIEGAAPRDPALDGAAAALAAVRHAAAHAARDGVLPLSADNAAVGTGRGAGV